MRLDCAARTFSFGSSLEQKSCPGLSRFYYAFCVLALSFACDFSAAFAMCQFVVFRGFNHRTSLCARMSHSFLVFCQWISVQCSFNDFPRFWCNFPLSHRAIFSMIHFRVVNSEKRIFCTSNQWWQCCTYSLVVIILTFGVHIIFIWIWLHR